MPDEVNSDACIAVVPATESHTINAINDAVSTAYPPMLCPAVILSNAPYPISTDVCPFTTNGNPEILIAPETEPKATALKYAIIDT